ncbi:LIC_10190 family membrane protein [Candidatus Margulisiibacteriota bacterium]
MIELLIIYLSWFLLFAAITGLGFWSHLLFKIRNKSIESGFSGFWIGWVILVACLQVIHLFMPLNLSVFVVIIFLGLVGFFINSRELFYIIKKQSLTKIIIITIVCLFFSIWISNQALAPITRHGNAGFYHLQTLKWISTYKTVPGLGNLDALLGYNQSHFLYQALLNNGYLLNKVHHFGNGLLLWVMMMQILFSLTKIFSDRNYLKRDIFRALFFPAVIYKCFYYASSLTPDLPLFILGIIISSELCFLFLDKDSPDSKRYSTLYICILSLLAVTIKLSFAVYAFFSIALSFFYYIYKLTDPKDRKSSFLKLSFFIFLCFLLIDIPWIIRNIILSGYLLYPISSFSLPVVWKMPAENVKFVAQAFKNMSFYSDIGLTKKIPIDMQWLKIWGLYWAKRFRYDILLLPALFLLMPLGIKYYKKQKVYQLLFLLPAFASVVFLFFYAPTPRFMGSAPFQLWLGSFVFFITGSKLFNQFNLKELFAIFIVCSLLLAGTRSTFIRPTHNAFFDIPKIKTKKVITQTGLVVNVPVSPKTYCWNSSLPCTMLPDPRLGTLEKGKMESGFKIYNELMPINKE